MFYKKNNKEEIVKKVGIGLGIAGIVAGTAVAGKKAKEELDKRKEKNKELDSKESVDEKGNKDGE